MLMHIYDKSLSSVTVINFTDIFQFGTFCNNIFHGIYCKAVDSEKFEIKVKIMLRRLPTNKRAYHKISQCIFFRKAFWDVA